MNRKFIGKLVKNDIIKELKTSSGTRIIIINPIYVNKNIRVDYTTYLCFVKKYLTPEEIISLNMLGTGNDIDASVECV